MLANNPEPTRPGVTLPHVKDATQNFGLFTGPQADWGLRVTNYKDLKGNNGKHLGFGVQTTVALFLIMCGCKRMYRRLCVCVLC